MTPLAAKLALRIEREGPLSIETYMDACLVDPEHGYYTTRDPFGAPGDFVTAPEVSQMFGELIGLWLWSVWQAAGEPRDACLVELGPGRGTLMADALRAMESTTRKPAPFAIHLVETSPTLRERQRRTLGKRTVTWHDTPTSLPRDTALYFVANEFFDALPIRQYVATKEGWRERLVGSRDGQLEPLLAQAPAGVDLPRAPIGRIGELSPVRSAVAAELAQRIRDQGGAALIIDFTDDKLPLVDTFQAVRSHAFADRFADPGEADLASAVDFAALSRMARESGVVAFDVISQGAFLRSLGIEARCRALQAKATPEQAAMLAAALGRLASPDGMGDDFRVLAMLPKDQPGPAGFEVAQP